MSWTSPRTWAAGEFWTAALVNEQLRDNMIALTPVLGEYKMFLRKPTAVETVIGTNWLECNGAAVSRANYSPLYNLFNTMRAARGSGTTTLTAAMDTTQTTMSINFWNHTWPGGRENWWTADYPFTPPFTIQIDAEKMMVTSKGVWDYKTPTVIRAREGTVAAVHNANATVTLAQDLPFGSGDGVTTFHLPDLHGRMLASAARAGGHVDVTTMGRDDRADLAARRPKHRHTWMATATGAVGGQVIFASGALAGQMQAWGNAGDWHYTNHGIYIGPLDEAGTRAMTTTPVDAPGYVVAGVYGIRFVA